MKYYLFLLLILCLVACGPDKGRQTAGISYCSCDTLYIDSNRKFVSYQRIGGSSTTEVLITRKRHISDQRDTLFIYFPGGTPGNTLQVIIER